jgi:hypothetical protein
MIVEPRGFWKLLTPLMKNMMHKRIKLIASEIEDYLKANQAPLTP